MTPQSIITTARYIIQDVDTTALRQDDVELTAYVNEAIKAVLAMAPNLFITVGDLTCTGGTPEQMIDFTNAERFVSVIRVKNGSIVTEASADAMNKFDPTWPSATPAPAVNWMKMVGSDPRRFYVNPPAPVGQVLEVEYVKIPPTYALTDTITVLPASAEPALANYVIARSESKDDEHVLSGRAMAHMTLFTSHFGGSAPQPQGAQ